MSIFITEDYIRQTKAITGFLAITVPLCSTLAGCLTYQFVHYISQINRTQCISGLIATGTLVITLLGMIFQILVFRTFTQCALLEKGPIAIPEWQLITLTVINYLTASFSRVYFARLASTMLKSPRPFICLSILLAILSMIGVILKCVFTLTNHTTVFDPNHHISWRSYSSQIIWIGSATVWDALICGALLYNFLNSAKRSRFGSLEGKASFGIALVFESFLLATFIMTIAAVAILVINVRLHIDPARLHVISVSLESLCTRFFGISTMCSLQHKVYEHLKIGQRLIHNPGPISNLKATPNPMVEDVEFVPNHLEFNTRERGYVERDSVLSYIGPQVGEVVDHRTLGVVCVKHCQHLQRQHSPASLIHISVENETRSSPRVSLEFVTEDKETREAVDVSPPETEKKDS
ncbi:hypothetical protein DFH28DRAFT_979971 [Melampsora americana]|nr:hypothetical protein DFH28DRAFT_979971 [Melampsora americana]